MEKRTKKKLSELIGKKQLLILIVCGVIGLILIVFPFDRDSSETENGKITVTSYTEKLENRVKDLCLAVDGVEKVEVLLTLESGSEFIYADNLKEAVDILFS